MREAGQDVPSSKPILEVNPEHPLLKHLKDEQDDDRFSDLSHVIVDQALLAEGSKITDPAQFVKRLNSFIVKSL